SGYISGGGGGGWNNRSGGRDREFNPFGDDDGTDQQFADQENTRINIDAYETSLLRQAVIMCHHLSTLFLKLI
ncbi:hypothetical protein R6Q59_012563, partial [Mikania micrantha]